MTLQRITDKPTARAWLQVCETNLATARAAADIDAVVEAAGALALARYAFRVAPSSARPRPTPPRILSHGLRQRRHRADNTTKEISGIMGVGRER